MPLKLSWPNWGQKHLLFHVYFTRALFSIPTHILISFTTNVSDTGQNKQLKIGLLEYKSKKQPKGSNIKNQLHNSCQRCFKNTQTGGWKLVQELRKTLHCSFRRSELDFQHPHQDTHNCLYLQLYTIQHHLLFLRVSALKYTYPYVKTQN